MAESAAPAAAAGTKPPKPDQDAFQENLKKAEKAHSDSMTRLNAIKAKIDLAQPNRNKDQASPAQKRRQELITEANEIRQKQGAGKNARTSRLDQIKRLDEQLRSRVNEQKTARTKVPFKSVEDLDRQIDSLDKQVGTGMMKLVDEKKALAEISSLRKQRKNFSQFDDAQKQIDDLRAKIKEIKDGMDDPESRALSDRYTKIQGELDAIKKEQDEAYKGLNSLRDERTKAHNDQREKFDAIKKLKDEYYGQKKAHQAWERESRARYQERIKAERERYEKEKKKERAHKMLAEASDPAYLEEIRRANSLLHFFDPTHVAEKGPLLANSGLGAQATRKVDDSGLKGTKLLRKEDREEDYLPAAKKGKKGKKGGAAAAGPDSSKSFNLPPSVVEDCAFMNIDPPMTAADLSSVQEKVRQKLDHWKADQSSQTQKNIEKAKKEIEKIEAEEAAEANGANDKAEDKAVAEVTADLKDTSVEDKKEEASA